MKICLDSEKWLAKARKRQSQIERFAKRKLSPKILNKHVRRTHHYREWISHLMTYTRIMELSLTWELLDLREGDRVMDISSPKLLAMVLAAHTDYRVHPTDVESYFRSDFEVYKQHFKLDMEVEVFDAQQIPHPDQSFDKCFSISVLEHVPDDGDRSIMQEMNRILRPGGQAVITLPAWPQYKEEWQKEKRFYWPTAQNDQGEYFYQRRYNGQAIRERLPVDGLEISELIYVAENPIEIPYMDNNGMLVHNDHLVSKMINRALGGWRRRIPFMKYRYSKKYSKKYHYLTEDETDPNIRQAVIQFSKT